MSRRATGSLGAIVVAMAVSVGYAAAQDSPPPPPTVGAVAPEAETPTTEAGPTTEVPSTEVPSTVAPGAPSTAPAGPVVLPTTVERPAGAPSDAAPEAVLGVTQTRPMPRTGGEFGPEVALGLALTAAGVALAAGARRRRHRLTQG